MKSVWSGDFVFGYWGLKDKVTNLLEVGGKTWKIIIVLWGKKWWIGYCVGQGQKLPFQTQTSEKPVPKMSALTFFYTIYHVKGAKKKKWSSCHAGNIFPRLKRGPIRVKSQSDMVLKQQCTTTWNGHKRHKDGLNTVRTGPTQDYKCKMTAIEIQKGSICTSLPKKVSNRIKSRFKCGVIVNWWNLPNMDTRGKEIFASTWKELYKILHLRTKELSLKKMCPFCRGKFIMRCLTVSTFFGAIKLWTW